MIERENETPTAALVIGQAATLKEDRRTESVHGFATVLPWLSETSRSKLEGPAVIGRPLTSPFPSRVRPAGRLPITDQLYEPDPFAAVSCCEYDSPVVPAGRGQEFVTATTGGVTGSRHD